MLAGVGNVIPEPAGTSPDTVLWSVTVVALTLCTAVPVEMFGPDTSMFGGMPAVAAKERTLPDGQSADVFALIRRLNT